MPEPSLKRWQELDRLFAEVLDRPEDERTAYLRATCGEDLELYREIEQLLLDCSEAESLLGESATAFATPLVDGLRFRLERESAAYDLAPGDEIGPYRVVSPLGRGGMGTVYLGERSDGAFDLRVAIKVVRRGIDTEDVLARFRRERQVLAELDHPNIARLIDGGAGSDGRPFLVMEYVDGTPITEYCDAHQLPVKARLRLFEQVAEAVQHAHRRLVVHRDLKPSNILVTEASSGKPEVKLLDFGIAKLLAEDQESDLTFAHGRHPMTPDYSAPEQRLGGPITTSADVFALGVVLYELVCGSRPSGRPDVAASPSSAIDQDAAMKRGTTPEKLARSLRDDLDTICLKAIRPEPERRYISVEALLDDLRRHQDQLPIAARPESVTYGVRKCSAPPGWSMRRS